MRSLEAHSCGTEVYNRTTFSNRHAFEGLETIPSAWVLLLQHSLNAGDRKAILPN